MTTPLTPAPFYFLRHGETDWNRRQVMQGYTDTSLSDYGRAQAAEVAPDVAKLKITTVCCSPLLRARQTAEIVTAGLGLPLVEIPDLKECGFGIYEGQDSNGPWRKPWLAGGAIPGGETYDGYLRRALGGLNQALSHPGPVLVVAHGGTFWSIDKYAGLHSGVRVPNCTLFQLMPPRASTEAWGLTQLSAPRSPAVAIGEARA